MLSSKKTNLKRVASALIAIFSILGIFVVQLFRIQLINRDEIAASKNVDVYTLKVEGARGEILDRNGNVLATNRQGNRIVFSAAHFPSLKNQSERNEIIISLIKLLESKGEEWNDNLPLILNPDGSVSFKENSDSYIEYLKSPDMLNLNHYATAQNCFDALKEYFSLQDYSDEDAIKIASVCVSLRKQGFSITNPYVFAEDVSSATIAAIKERSDFYRGVEHEVVTYREYPEKSLAAHLIGTVGAISQSEYENAKNALEQKLKNPNLTEEEKRALEKRSYDLDDIYGKSGVEKLMEEYLKGADGYKVISRDTDGNLKESYIEEPEKGETVILTIDAGLQKAAEIALEKRIKELTAQKGLEAAGAVAVIDVNTGELLASASYPGYDLSTYYENYSKLASDPAAPLWNRVLQSTYAPGSTFKPLVAIAALETGTVNKYDQYICNSVFHYKGMDFRCLRSHGRTNVVEAIEKSCNIYFYNVADILGINKMNEYATAFGLGSKTGIELPEAEGVLAGIPYRESLGKLWLPGDTIQASIGQSDNLFTPLQLVNYCAAIANGGTRYVPHIIKEVKTPDKSSTIMKKDPAVAFKTNISASTFATVKEGMLRAVTQGSLQSTFKDLKVQAAAKTGTSQTVKIVNGRAVKGNNGFVISFAPYENPEIAVVVLIENVDSGTATAKVAADIYEYYFGTMKSVVPQQPFNTLLP